MAVLLVGSFVDLCVDSCVDSLGGAGFGWQAVISAMPVRYSKIRTFSMLCFIVCQWRGKAYSIGANLGKQLMRDG